MTALLPGAGALRVALASRGSIVEMARARSPLRLFLPNNHGDAAWVFSTNLGGGLVDGDEAAIDVEVSAGAKAVLATQASTKVYRSRRGCRQSVTGRIASDASLAVLSDPVLCFAGARLDQRLSFSLEPGATLVVLDGVTSGRAARGERWAFESSFSRIRVTRSGVPMLHDAIRLAAEEGDLAARMGQCNALLTVVAIGPRARGVAERMSRDAPRPEPGSSEIRSVAPLADGAIGRIASESVEGAVARSQAWLEPFATELGDDPFARKSPGAGAMLGADAPRPS